MFRPDESKCLTPRQQSEINYHVHHAARLAQETQPESDEVIEHPTRKWWNHYWAAYSILSAADVRGKSLLVPGCGSGIDAIRCAKMGASVTAFDLSQEMLDLARMNAARARVPVEFLRMPAEQLEFPDDTFDVIFVHDLLHHCDIKLCLSELARVAKPGAFALFDELYTHRMLQALRNSALGRSLYLKLAPYIYHHSVPYITPDERKLDETELDLVRTRLVNARCKYFYIVVNRVVSDADALEIADRILTQALGTFGRFLAGRVLLTGSFGRRQGPESIRQ